VEEFMNRYYWVTVGDWCRWTLQHRNEVEEWCRANDMQLAIDNNPDQGGQELERKAWGGSYRR
jgi:hypothetical protein